MSRKPCCVGEGLKKGAWTAEEDKKLISYIHENGEGGWRDIPQKAGLKRCGKSCRLRWANYLKPDIKRGEFSYEEEQIIIMLHASRGNKWSVIARHLPKRTDNEIKNYWNTHLKKRLIDQGIDPVTHKPLASSPSPDSSKSFDLLDDKKLDEEQSQSGPMSPNSLLLSSDSQAAQEINENPRDVGDFLICKKPSFKGSRSTSRLLNKVASKAASIGKILSASMEGDLMSTSTILSSSLNEFSENIQFQMDQFDQLFSQSSDHVNLDVNNSHDYNFSHFLDQFSQNDKVETENINGGYNNQDLLVSDVSSTSVDYEGNIIENITDWSNYLLDNLDFIYEMDQDSNEKK